MPLKLEINTTQPDEMYEIITSMHDGLTRADSERANAKLILLLANQVGDVAVLRQAAEIARENVIASKSPGS
jgi:hypothetical protein